MYKSTAQIAKNMLVRRQILIRVDRLLSHFLNSNTTVEEIDWSSESSPPPTPQKPSRKSAWNLDISDNIQNEGTGSADDKIHKSVETVGNNDTHSAGDEIQEFVDESSESSDDSSSDPELKESRRAWDDDLELNKDKIKEFSDDQNKDTIEDFSDVRDDEVTAFTDSDKE